MSAFVGGAVAGPARPDAAPPPVYALKARQLMPPALQGQLARHERALLEGWRADPPAGVSAEGLLDELSATRATLADRVAFDGVARRFGRLARLTFEIQEWVAQAGGEEEAAWLADFARYVDRRRDRFVPVFYEYAPSLFRAADPRAYVDDMRHRARDLAGRAVELYRAGGRSRQFDDRSPAFGLAALQHSRLITDVANLWLFCWREANGDMSGTPFYRYPARRAELTPGGDADGSDSNRAVERFR